MAQITVVYKDFDEMVAVARELLKGEQKPDLQKEEKSIPYGQQIAPHFPNANTGQVSPVTATHQHVDAATQISEAPAQQMVPTAAPSYTRDDLSRAAMTLMDKGMQTQLQQLIQSYGVNSLVELQPERYGNFATALRGMGAQI